MKRFAALVLTFFGVLAMASERTVLNDLAVLRWKNRLVVVNEPHNRDELLTVLTASAAAIDERRIVWFLVNGDQVLSNYPGTLGDGLADSVRAHLGPAQSAVVLMGLDGGVKKESDRLDLDALYSTVDAMPMRQRER